MVDSTIQCKAYCRFNWYKITINHFWYEASELYRNKYYLMQLNINKIRIFVVMHLCSGYETIDLIINDQHISHINLLPLFNQFIKFN